jgi:hypothetical protein
MFIIAKNIGKGVLCDVYSGKKVQKKQHAAFLSPRQRRNQVPGRIPFSGSALDSATERLPVPSAAMRRRHTPSVAQARPTQARPTNVHAHATR